MDELKISTFPQQRRVLSGESLVTQTVFINNRDSHVNITSIDVPSPYWYRLTGDDDSHREYVVTNDRPAGLNKRDSNYGLVEQPPYSLSPKSKISRQDDLAALAAEPFAPGRYRLVAFYDRDGHDLSSLPSGVEIVAPQIEKFSSHVSILPPSLGTAFAHREPDGSLAILQRESARNFPQSGVFFRRHRLEASARVGDLTLAVDAAHINGGRWLAWLQDETLAALKAWGSRAEVVAPAATGLTGARFVHPGFQFEDGSGLFLVCGHAGGVVRLQAYAAAPDGCRQLWGVELSRQMPRRILASYKAHAGLQLIWTEETPEAVGIYSRLCDLRGNFREAAPALLLELSEPLAALEIQALAQSGTVHLLSGGQDAKHSMSYRRISTQGAVHVSDPVRFDAPETPVEAWGISTLDEGSLPVLASSGGQILLKHLRAGGDWQPVAERVGTIQHLKVFSIDPETLWLEWVDSRLGHRLKGIYI